MNAFALCDGSLVPDVDRAEQNIKVPEKENLTSESRDDFAQW